MEHPQVWAKVNAPVDQGLVELIETLSLFRPLQTIESCQGNAGEYARVSFIYGCERKEPWKKLAEFVLGFLGPELAKNFGDRVHTSIRVGKTNSWIQGELLIENTMVDEVTEFLKTLSKEQFHLG
jgi:hypothetical protein